MVEIKNVSFAYGKKQVLHDISLNVQKGKITTLLGANGSGKTTLFKVITGCLKPQSGEINFDGNNVKTIKQKELAKIVSIVHQNNVINEDISVETLVGYGRVPYLKFMGQLNKHDYDKINEAIKLADLESIRHQNFRTLSGGQKQRVWIAMALAQDTDIIFLDEPTTFLDIRYQIEILELIKKLNSEYGKTIVMVVHDISQALTYSDDIIGLVDGKIIIHDKVNKISDETINHIYSANLKIKVVEGHRIVIFD